MHIPKIKGIIDRRILINFAVQAEALARFLPPPFRPQLINGFGIAGICLIRLKNIRPAVLPIKRGIRSENGAHRIAVVWEDKGELKHGVYIPRRDTSSWINSISGGLVFPGLHHLSDFVVNEIGDNYSLRLINRDGTHLSIAAKETSAWTSQSIFDSLEEASTFFECGSIGYSPAGKKYHGLELRTKNWEVSNLAVTQVESSFFKDTEIFPEGTVRFDNALLMKNIEHEWIGLQNLRV
ncbi:MAG: DUF2071 domain-containing protein [Bacteroidota bacterium]